MRCATQVCAEIGVTVAILRCRTVPLAVVQDRTQPVVLRARNGELLVHDDARYPLARALGREDIPDLVQAFLARASRRGRQPIGITDEALRWLCSRDWPGNVRELANAIERAVALAEHDTIVLADVRDHAKLSVLGDDLNLADAAKRHLPLSHVELAYIRQVIAELGGNMAHAARVLGIDRRTLYRKLEADR